MKKALSRFASPAGFALVLLLFGVLPFASVSCGTEFGDASVTYNGLDLATGTSPEVETSGVEGFQELAAEQQRELAIDSGVGLGAALLALAVVALLVAGILARRMRRPAAALAGISAVLVVVIDLIVRANLGSTIREAALAAEAGMGEPEIERLVTDGVAREFGFWVTVAGLVLLTGYNVIAAVRERRADAG